MNGVLEFGRAALCPDSTRGILPIYHFDDKHMGIKPDCPQKISECVGSDAHPIALLTRNLFLSTYVEEFCDPDFARSCRLASD